MLHWSSRIFFNSKNTLQPWMILYFYAVPCSLFLKIPTMSESDEEGTYVPTSGPHIHDDDEVTVSISIDQLGSSFCDRCAYSGHNPVWAIPVPWLFIVIHLFKTMKEGKRTAANSPGCMYVSFAFTVCFMTGKENFRKSKRERDES